MKNPWVRSVVLILGAILAAAALGAGGLFYLISRLDVRAEIERVVEEATGRDLAINGDVGVTFWPVLGLKAERASLANVEGGRAPALVTMAELDIGVEIRPLLNRDVVVRRLVLQKPQVALETDAAGNNNWTLTPRTPLPPVGETPPPTTPEQQAPPAQQGRFSLREVRTVDGEVSYYDARQGTGWIIGDADLTTSIESLDVPVRLEGELRYAERPLSLNIVIGAPRSAMAGRGSAAEIKIDSDLLQVEFSGAALANGVFQGNLNASGPNLRELASWTGTPIQGGYGLEAFSVSGRIGVNGGEYAFSNATFNVDRIAGRGDFTLSQLRGKPYLSGRLELMDFDLNPYLPGQAPPPETVETAAAEGPVAPSAAPVGGIAVVEAPVRAVDVAAAPSETPIDFSGLRGVNADLELVTHAVLVQRMRLDSARLSLVLNDGFLASTLHDVRLYGGSASGRMEVDARELAVKLAQELNLQGVDAHQFLSDAINLDNLEGRAELQINVRTQGRTQSELVSGIGGRTHIEIVSGAIRGVDLGGVSRTIRNALRGELIAPEARTPFNGFSATFAIADGVLASNNLSFNTPDLRIPGIGVIDVPQRRMDLRLAPRSSRGGIVFPFAIRGPFDQLAYTSDIRDTALREITARVTEVQAAARAEN
jgi:AsmA protein